MNVSFEIHNRVMAKMQECIKIIAEQSGVTINPSLAYDLRGTKAGQAVVYWDKTRPKVRLNKVLLMENVETMINQTLPHEMAHVAQFAIYGRIPGNTPHGIYWQRIMGWLGLDAHRCHSYDVTNARVYKKRRFEFTCGCRTHNVTVTIVKRINAGQVYTCRVCGNKIREKFLDGQASLIGT